MITKRIYPLDAALNIVEEAWNLGKEFKAGTLDGKDLAAAGSNVVIKTGATTAGAIVGGAVGTVLGPAGAAVGTYIGGMAGAWIGDGVAGFVEDIIEDGPKAAIENVGNKIGNTISKGFNWAKGLFK